MKPISLLFLILFSAVMMLESGCQKDTTCKAVVTCIDSTGSPVQDAYVYLYAPVKSADGKTTYTGDITASGNTDSDGSIQFSFELPAIFDVKATAVRSKTLTGTAVIKLEEGSTVDKTVTLR